jgi:hypothetical protein
MVVDIGSSSFLCYLCFELLILTKNYRAVFAYNNAICTLNYNLLNTLPNIKLKILTGYLPPIYPPIFSN